jgi:hypothetical protein
MFLNSNKMDIEGLRYWLSGAGFLVGGGALAIVSWSESGVSFLTAMLGLLSLSGAFILTGRQHLYKRLLPFVGILAVATAAIAYQSDGASVPVAGFGLFGVVSILKGLRFYSKHSGTLTNST